MFNPQTSFVIIVVGGGGSGGVVGVFFLCLSVFVYQ